MRTVLAQWSQRLGMRSTAYRGVPVHIHSKEVGLALIEAVVKGSTRVAADMLLEAMATGERNHWWSVGDHPADEAGRWWTTDLSAAYQYAQGIPDPEDFLVVPVVLTASYDDDAWQGDQDSQGHFWYHLDPGTPINIVSIEADLPGAAALQAWMDEVASQGEYAVHGAIAVGYGEGFKKLPVPPMRTTAGKMNGAMRGLHVSFEEIERATGVTRAELEKASPDRVGKVLFDTMMGRGGVGVHWTTDRAAAFTFALGSRGHEVGVVLMAEPDRSDGRAWAEQWQYDKPPASYTPMAFESEVALRSGAPLKLSQMAYLLPGGQWTMATAVEGLRVTAVSGSGRTTKTWPDLVRTWEQTRPWAATQDDVASGNVPGFAVGDARGSEAASWEDRWIVLKPDYWSFPVDARRSVIYHEAGHALETSLGLRGVEPLYDQIGVDMWSPPGTTSGLFHGGDPVAILADGYSELWSDGGRGLDSMGLGWLKTLTALAARQAGFPLPSGVTASYITKVEPA